jgi:hypothetical protein
VIIWGIGMAKWVRSVTVAVLAAAAVVAVPGSAEAATTPSWVTAALADQYELGNTLPLRDAPWWGTHNSFNSVAEMGPALSALDPNQDVTITKQLDLGARQLEIDVHWVFSLSALLTGLYAPVVCHALSGGTGCTVEKPLATVLQEIAGWLHLSAHRDQVLLLYVEDDLQNQTGYQTAGQTIATQLGGLVYRPTGGGCQSMPLQLTRNQVLAAGAQVIVVTNSCGVGTPTAWQGETFDWSSRHLEAQPRTYSDYPACGTDFTRAQYDSTTIRYFEEMGHLSTLAGAGGFPITPAYAADMQRCGVDLVSLDFLKAGDARLPALVWSWAPNEPSAAGSCTLQGSDGRWIARPCGESHPAACRTASGAWALSTTSVTEADAAAACAADAGSFDVPRTGYQNELLHLAANGTPVWLNHAR